MALPVTYYGHILNKIRLFRAALLFISQHVLTTCHSACSLPICPRAPQFLGAHVCHTCLTNHIQKDLGQAYYTPKNNKARPIMLSSSHAHLSSPGKRLSRRNWVSWRRRFQMTWHRVKLGHLMIILWILTRIMWMLKTGHQPQAQTPINQPHKNETHKAKARGFMTHEGPHSVTCAPFFFVYMNKSTRRLTANTLDQDNSSCTNCLC